MALLIGGTLAYLYLPFPWWLLVVIGLAAFESLEVLFWLWLRKQRPVVGSEAMVGEHGVLSTDRRVRIRGTSYPARVSEGRPGDRVVVESVEGMTLVVRRAVESPHSKGG